MAGRVTTGDAQNLEHLRLMLGVYEKERGSALGLDFAREARVFERNYRFIPPQDDEERAMLADLFREQLATTRFAQSAVGWFKARQDRAKIVELVSVIPPDRALARAYETVLGAMGEVLDVASEFNRAVMAPIYRALQHRDSAELMTALKKTDVHAYDERFDKVCERLVQVKHDAMDAVAVRRAISADVIKEFARFAHGVVGDAHGIVGGAETNIAFSYDLASQDELDAAAMEAFSTNVEAWHRGYERFAHSYFTRRFLEWKRKVDTQVMNPLSAILEPVYSDTTRAEDVAEALLAEIKKRDFLSVMEGLENEVQSLSRHVESWSLNVAAPYPQNDEQVRCFSTIKHEIGAQLHTMLFTVGSLRDNVSVIYSGARPFDGFPERFKKYFKQWRSVDANVTDLPPLRYAESLGARVVKNSELPADINKERLCAIFMYLIGNARDFPRPEYKDGDKFEVVVTIDPGRVTVSDNGRGMTEARLAEVEEAMRTRKPIESDHGGTGRGLIDVASIVPKLFTGNIVTPPTYQIQSMLGVGTTFTIHFSPTPARVR